jgi:hypothetical protein
MARRTSKVNVKKAGEGEAKVPAKHLASFAVKSASPPAAKDPLVARMR